MENRVKKKISQMYHSSLGSCRHKNISDVIRQPLLTPQNPHHHQLMELFYPNRNPKPPLPFPSIYTPKSSKPPHRNTNLFPKAKLTPNNIPPLSLKQRKPRKSRNRASASKQNEQFDEFFSSNYHGSWYTSSEDEKEDKYNCHYVEDDDETSLFSLNSISSGSPEAFLRNKEQTRSKNEECEKGLMELKGKVRDSIAVVKSSSDPYKDFRTSMVEMIVERHLFGYKDLEYLLQCFLTLNSDSYHGIIVEVFVEIWETLFNYVL